LVSLAKNTDAAHQAASAGHPTALLGLDTAVRATNANVNHITNTLATAVVPNTGVDLNTVQPVVNPNPGSHAPLQTIPDQAGQLIAAPDPSPAPLGHSDTTGPVHIPPAGPDAPTPPAGVHTYHGHHGHTVLDGLAGGGSH